MNEFEIADSIIEHVYPDINRNGKGWWGSKRIPNYGILRGAIAREIHLLLSRIECAEKEIEQLKKKVIDTAIKYGNGKVTRT